MTLDQLGSLGDFVSGAGVVASLIYLAVQVRHSNVLRRRDQETRGVEANNEVLAAMAADPGLTGILVRGYADLDDLDEVERYRFDLSVLRYLDNLLQMFEDYRVGAFSEARIRLLRRSTKQFLSTPGMSAWWAERKRDWFAEPDVQTIDALLTDPRIEVPPFRARGPALIHAAHERALGARLSA